MLRAAALLAAPALAAGHGAMGTPAPRAMRGLRLDGADCDPGDYGKQSNGKGDKKGCSTGCLGEACMWFNDGCVIGCDTCANSGTYGIYGQFEEEGCKTNGVPNNEPPMPTEVLPAEFRTWDVRGKPGCTECSPNWKINGYSITKNHPWMAPGHSPVTNPCGISSGVVPNLPGGGDGHGKMPVVPKGFPQGMNGTDVPPVPGVLTKWKAGSVQETSWAIIANHGGGYQYRLCPKSEEPTEACFQRHPLEFVGKTTTIRKSSGNKSAPDFEIPAMDVNVGTSPKGSSWRRNPIPACNCDLGIQGACGSPKFGANNQTVPYWIDPEAPKKTPLCPTGVQFPPAWPEGYGYGTEWHAPGDGWGKADGMYSLVDNIRVPEQKGEYVLAWRCADSHTKQDYRLLVSDQRCCKVGL